MNTEKRVGWFNAPKVWNPKYAKIENLFREQDNLLPIVGSSLTRNEIFKVLWDNLSQELSHRLKFQSNDDEKINVLQLLGILIPLTEILAYPLSAKKISGLGSVTNAKESIQIDDKVLKKLFQIDDLFESIRLTKEHKKFYPPITKKILDLQKLHKDAIRDYVISYKREERFLQTCCESIDNLSYSVLSKQDQKQIIKEALDYFKQMGFTIYVKSLDRLFHKDFYETVHSESFLSDGTDVSSYYIKRVLRAENNLGKKKKNA